MFTDYSGINLIYILITIVISLSIHEMMHGLVAYKLGDTTAEEAGRLSLNPLRHIDPFTTVILPIITLLIFQVPVMAAKPVPFNPARVKYDEFGGALIAAAGPLSNLVLAFVAALLLRGPVLTGPLANFLVVFAEWNVALFVFNILPIPPLDGSRILYAFAPEPLQQIMIQMEPYGLFIIFALVLSRALTGLLITLNNDVLRWLP